MFEPRTGETLQIDSERYTIAPHPNAPDVPYGQEGRQATVYKLLSDKGQWALKVFKPRYRQPYIARISGLMSRYSHLPGMAVCGRKVVSHRKDMELLKAHNELAYAVLMPWISGRTWMETLLLRTRFSPQQSLAMARAFLEVMATLEEEGISHGDISSSNIMLPMLNGGQGLELVDVEQIYIPGMERPDVLPEGSPGYGFPSGRELEWGPFADRYGGSIAAAEMLASCDGRALGESYGESFFSEKEQGQETPRFNLMAQTLENRWGRRASEIFKQNWLAASPERCLPFIEWLVCLPEHAEPEQETSTADVPQADQGPTPGKKIYSPQSPQTRWKKIDAGEVGGNEAGADRHTTARPVAQVKPGDSSAAVLNVSVNNGLKLSNVARASRMGALGDVWNEANQRVEQQRSPMFRLNRQRTAKSIYSGVRDFKGKYRSFKTRGAIATSPVIHRGCIYFGSMDGYFYSLGENMSDLKWRIHVDKQALSSPAVEDGVIYFGGTGGCYAVTEAYGDVVWNFQTGGRVDSSPVVYDGAVFVGCDDGYLYAMRTSTGQLDWRRKTKGGIESSPAVYADSVIFGSGDKHLYSVDILTGRVRWKFKTAGEVGSSPAVVGGLVLFGSDDCHFYALEQDSGRLVWSLATEGGVYSSPAVSRGTAYFGNDEGCLYAADLWSGAMKWTYQTSASIQSSPVVAGDVVYFGNSAGYVLAVDCDKGKPLWRFKTDGPIDGSPLVADGAIYVGSYDCSLYALYDS